ncbi:MAG: hypothetical protein IBJ18_02085 [Phycisphaerales bacterium]|nr:hypothetical protein [Phycisphaerales bacterium]
MNSQNDRMGVGGVSAGSHGAVEPHVGFDPSGFPDALRTHANWICWRPVQKEPGAAWTKVPISPVTGNAASVKDPSGWTSLEKAEAFARQRGLGLGFVFTDEVGLVGIDLDECVDEQGQITAEAAGLIARLNSYAEFTPSGRGVRVIILAKKTTAKCTASSVCGAKKIEIYDSGRYFTMTGRPVNGLHRQIEARQAELETLCEQLWREQEPRTSAASGRVNAGASDEEVLALARKGRGGKRFAAMYDRGDLSRVAGDDSRGDFAVCRWLARFTADAGQIDRLFRASKLMRDKWDERRGEGTYGMMTIQRAMQRAATPAVAVDQPEVVLGTDEHRVVDEVIGHLGAEPVLFQRGGLLVRVVPNGDGVRVEPVTEPTLRRVLTRRVRLLSVRDGEEIDAHPPAWLTAQIMAHGTWPGVRELTGVLDFPILRPDGSIFSEIGYDLATKVLRVGEMADAQSPTQMAKAEARAALMVLKDLMCDFPFATDRDLSAALAMLITMVARSAYEGPTPLFLIEANQRGSGKTFLALVAGMLARMGGVAISSMTKDDEFRKFVTSAAIRGESVVILDNLSGSIGGSTLDRVLTATQWSDRPLGSSTIIDVPMSTVWIATGNNPDLQADIHRRIIPIRLCTPLEHPEHRGTFVYPDLLAHVTRNRQRYIAACLRVLQAYLSCGEQTKIRAMGSFGGWSSLVRAALVWLGEPDPLPEPGEMGAASDAQAEALARLLSGIAEERTLSRGFHAADLVNIAHSGSKMYHPIREALIELQLGDEQLTPQRVGTILRRCRDRVAGGRRLVSGGKTMLGVRWMVEPVPGESVRSSQGGVHDDHDDHDADLKPLPLRALRAPRSATPGDGEMTKPAKSTTDGMA